MRKMTYTQAATCGESLKVRVTPEQSEKMQRAWFAAGKTWADGSIEICETDSCFLYLHQDNELSCGCDEKEFFGNENTAIELIDEPQHEPEYTIDELINMRGVYFWVNDEQSKEFKQKWKGKNNLSEGCNYYIIITEQGYLAWESESLKHHITERLVKIKPVVQKSEPQHDFASQQEVWEWLVQGNKVVLKDFGDIYGFNCVGKLNNFSSPYKSTDISFSVVENWKKYTPPRLIRVNGVEVPAPLESLDGLETIYITCCSTPQYPIEKNVDSACRRQQDLSLCYATKEDAIKRAEAMLKFEVVE